ncbi:zinc finger protein 471-like isoform X2 [Mercenaria mercenaria]|nr:zinc finger protein 471-like isoform X2 [Mercenaria mercenaria]
METTGVHVIEVHKIAAEQEKSSGPLLLDINSTLGNAPTLGDSLSQNNCIVKVYHGHADNATGVEIPLAEGEIPPDAVFIPAGSLHPTSDSSAIVKIVKPQNVHVSANEENSTLDTVYTETVDDTEKFIATPLVEDSRNKIGSHSLQVKKLLHATDSRQLDTRITDHASNENSSEKKSPVIMFKWGSVKKPFRCHICDMSFNDGNLLREHLEKHNSSRKEPSKPFPCNLCIKSFQTNRSLERHQFVHSGQTQKRCKYCYKIFANKENLDKHIQMHNGNKAYSCLFCSEQFSSRPCLEKHIASHKTNIKKFKCTICDKNFNRKDILDRHLLTHDIGKKNKHECVECRRSFSYLFALKRHVRSVHGGEPDGKTCEVCGKFIKNRENIGRHMQLHEGKRPYDCQECGRKFTQKQHLVDHMVTHTNAFPFECKFCCVSFRYKRSLGRHVKKHYTVHADIQKLECVECRLMFSSENEIVRHVESTHYNFKECLMCKEIFGDEKSCIKHMLKVHDLPVAVINKSMNLVNKSTETDPAGPACNMDPAGPDCNTDTAGLEGNTGIVTAENGKDMDAEDTTPDDEVDNEIEKLKNEFEYANERRKDVFSKEENIQSKIDETVPENQQVIYILFDNGKEVCAVQKMDVEKVIPQSGLPVSEYTQVQVPSYISHGNQIILASEPEEQPLEADADDDSRIAPTTEGTESEREETGNIKIAESNLNLYHANETAGTNEKAVEYTYNVVMPEGEKEDGSMELEESKYVAERSKLLQSLIDYAEKIQEAEQSVSSTEATSNSETKI